MAGRSAFTRGPRISGESESPMRASERQRRSLSQSDDTLRPPGVLANPPASHDPGSATSSHFHSSAEHSQHPSKRLGFLGEMLSSSTNSGAGGSTRGQPNQIPPRSHSRADSANLLRENAVSPAPTLSKAHPSPSKLVSREMHRLGNLAHLPSLNSSISAPSTSSLTVTAQSSSMSVASAGSDAGWPALHQYILPLFNGEPLKVPIEELNTLVKHHIQGVASTPSKALGSLEHDANEIILNGMVTLSARLNGIDNEKMVSRVVDLWTFFWGQVLPYVEGALLPLQTEPLLFSFYYRMQKGHKAASPTTIPQHGKGTGSSSFKSHPIDVRTMALQSFRDQIIYPVHKVLHEQLMAQREQASGNYQYPKLQQMLLVLISQRSLPVTYSLTDPPPPPPPGEEAVSLLLRAIRTPSLPTNAKQDGVRKHYFAGTGAPSFLSAGLPRDRRGRIAQKAERRPYTVDEEYDEWRLGEETPRVGSGYSTERNAAREREREFLESLRSPDPDPENPRASMGGWGLGDGLGGGETQRMDEDELYGDVEGLDWDKTQDIVERMVGMKT